MSEEGDFILLAGIGGFRPGYSLFLPQEHVPSFAYLSPSALAQAERVFDAHVRRLARLFGPGVVFEHGATESNHGGGCIDHAHLHWAPLGVQMSEPEGLSMQDHLGIAHLSGLRGRPYLYLDQGAARVADLSQGLFPSQFFRRLLAAAEGFPDEWDWAIFPNVAHAIATVESWKASLPHSM